MAIKTDITFFQGEDFLLQLSIVDDDDNPVDIAGFTFESTIRTDYGEGVAAGPYTSGSGLTIIDAGAGRVDLIIPDADTTNLDARNYVWDVKRMDADAEVILAYGKLHLLPAVTL